MAAISTTPGKREGRVLRVKNLSYMESDGVAPVDASGKNTATDASSANNGGRKHDVSTSSSSTSSSQHDGNDMLELAAIPSRIPLHDAVAGADTASARTGTRVAGAELVPTVQIMCDA